MLLTQPSVCVVIAAYNAQMSIARAIRSALAEPEVTEIIIVDDASTDGTVQEARALADDERLKILVQARNSGPSAARNRAIAESTAPWIALLDADDFFLPGRMKRLLAFTDQADLIADDLRQVTQNDIYGDGRSLLPMRFNSPRTISFCEFVLSNVSHGFRMRGELGFIKPLMRREFLHEHRIRYQEQMRLGEDYELYARALAAGARLLLIPEQGYVSVIRPDSLSGKHSEADLLHLRDCDRELLKLVTLPSDKAALRRHYRNTDCRLQWRLLINAVKEQNVRAILAAFARPFPVPLYLAMKLGEQFCLRSASAIKQVPSAFYPRKKPR